MTTEDIKAMARRLYEDGFNKGNVAVLDELVAEAALDHQAPPGIPPGREGLKQLITLMRSAFPDLTFLIEDVIAEGDKVVVRSLMRGTHQGMFMGIPPSGNPVQITGIDVIRVAEGRFVEHWGNQDDLGMMQQIGAVPAMPSAGGL